MKHIFVEEKNGLFCFLNSRKMIHKEVKPRQRILEAVSHLFHYQGYNATGVNQIVQESGVGKSSLYQHFRSKEEIAVAYLNERHIFWFDKLVKSTSSQKSAEEKVLAAFDFIIDMNEKEEYRGCSFLNMLSEIPKENTILLTVIQQHKQELQNFFKTTLKDTGIDWTHIYFLFESAIIESKLFTNAWPVHSAKSIIQSLFTHYYGTETSLTAV